MAHEERSSRAPVTGGACSGMAGFEAEWDPAVASNEGEDEGGPAPRTDRTRTPEPAERRGAPDAGRRSVRGDPGDDHECHRRSLLVAAGAAATAALAGCSDSGGDGGGSSDEEQIREVLRKNAQTIEDEDLDAHMETIHPDSPAYDTTETQLQQLFQVYDLTVELTIESVDVDGDSATADVVQTTRSENDASSYEDNRTWLTHELRTHEGDWKIYNSATTDIERL